MHDVLEEIVDAAFEIKTRLNGTRFEIKKITVSSSALTNIKGRFIRVNVGNPGEPKLCDIPLFCSGEQTEDFAFTITTKK